MFSSDYYDDDSDAELLSGFSVAQDENERYKRCKSVARSRIKNLESEKSNDMGRKLRLKGRFLQSPNTAQLIYDDLQRFIDTKKLYLREVEVNSARDGYMYQTVTLEFSSGEGLEQVKAYLDGLKQSKNGIRKDGIMQQMLNPLVNEKLPPWLLDLKERKTDDKLKYGRSYGPMTDASVLFPHMFEIGNTVKYKRRQEEVFYPRYRWSKIKAEFSVPMMSLKVFLKHESSAGVTSMMLEILIKSVVGYAYKTERNLVGEMQDAIVLKLSRPPFVHIGKNSATNSTSSYYCGEDFETVKILYERSVDFLPESESIARSFTYFFYFQRNDGEDQREFRWMIDQLKELKWYSGIKQKQWENTTKISFDAYGTDRAKETHQRVQQLIAELHFRIAYRITSLLARGLVVEEALDPEINSQRNQHSILNIIQKEMQDNQQSSSTVDAICDALDCMNFAAKAWDDPSTQFKKQMKLKRSIYGRKKTSSMYNPERSMMNRTQKCLIAKVLVTPTRIIPIPMQVELTNRVVRNYKEYQDRFSRAQFVDENEDLIIGWDNKTDLRARIQDVMEKGFQIGNLRFEWLHYSNSGLRQHSAWFFAPQGLPEKIRPEAMRQHMGDFSKITNVPKYAARMGQCFSTTVQTAAIHQHLCLQQVQDIKSDIDGRPYSDGCGTISQVVRNEILKTHPRIQIDADLKPCAFQIRYAGVKGMVCVRPGVRGRKLRIRDSMKKFDSKEFVLEVCQISQAMTAFLNRQIIVLLKTLGVNNAAFHQLLSVAISELKNVSVDRAKALTLLRSYISHKTEMTRAIQKFVEQGFNLQDPLIKGMLEAIRVYHLKDMKKKAKIRVEQAVRLLGVVDEEGILESDEVFFQIQRTDDTEPQVIEGNVLITRNPCLFPGDVRMARAVNKEGLKDLVNVLVFNTKQTGTQVKYEGEEQQISERIRVPLPHMCAGGDLDGDDYFITWDASLFPEQRDLPSLEYIDSIPQKTANITARDCQQHFLGFMSNCNIGVISNAHLVWADKHLVEGQSEGAYCKECIILAQEADKAVNYGKYGQEARMPIDLKPQSYPHYMEKIDKPSHHSSSILGKLYDQLAKEGTGTMFKQTDFSANNIQVESSLVLSDVDGFYEYVQQARELRDEFIQDVWTIMCRYQIFSEQQLWSGVFLKPGNKSDRNNDAGLEERITDEMEDIFQRYKAIFYEEFKDQDTDSLYVVYEESKILKKYVKASAWYSCVYDSSYRGRVQKVGPGNVIILGFGFIPYNELCIIRNERDLSIQY